MAKLVFVLLDGLAFDASRTMIWPEKVGAPVRFCSVRAEYPPLSKPAYATLFSGKKPCEHGIFENSGFAAAPSPNIFEQARAAGLVSCAAAYYWFFELYNRLPFIPARHRFLWNAPLTIANGLFYWNDSYPDAELFADAEACRNFCRPDFMLAHCMGIDWQGHLHGANSAEYKNAVKNVDALLAAYAPIWLRDAILLVASDHGMDNAGKHEADNDECRLAPFWLAGEGIQSMPMPSRACEMAALLEEILFGGES